MGTLRKFAALIRAQDKGREAVAWYHDDFGVLELSRIRRVGWKPLYAAPPASEAHND